MGGSPSIPQRNFPKELQQIFGAFPQLTKAFDKFTSGEPLLQNSEDFALNNLENIGDLTGPLSDLMDRLPGRLDKLFDKSGSLYNRAGSILHHLPGVQGLVNPLQKMLGDLGQVNEEQLMPILNTGGRLTQEQEHDVQAHSFADAAELGNLRSPGAIGTHLLERDQFRQNRFNNALTQSMGISGQEQGLTSGIEGLRATDTGLRSGLLGLQSNILGQQGGLLGLEGSIPLSLASGIEGLDMNALQGALGTEGAKTGSFMSLMGPLLGFGQDVFSSNQNAAAAQNIAGANKSSGALGGGLSALGSIAGGIGMAL